ncbi:MAG TPA: hypothetical protein VIV64_08780 [Gammaproteobacteria bacterium]|jgi:hypothetical protein
MERSRLVTLDAVAALATFLFRLRRFLLGVCVIAGAWFVVSVVDSSAASARALLPLSLGLWSALALGIGYTLTRRPPAIGPEDGFGRRLSKRLVLAAYVVAVAGILALAAFAVLFSVRALDLALL